MRRVLAVLAVVFGCVGAVRAADEDEVKKRIDILKDQDKSISTKRTAIYDLANYGAKAEPALPVLKEFLFTPQTADAVISTLGRVGKKGVPMLVEVLEAPYPVKLPLSRGLSRQEYNDATRACDNHLSWKQAAVQRLGEMWSDAAVAVKPLLTVINTDEYKLPSGYTNRDLRRYALYEIGRIAGEDDAKAVAIKLGEFLKDRQDASYAMQGLQQMGPRAKDALPAMIAMVERFLKKEREAVSSSEVSTAVYVFQAIGPDAADALPVLRALLKTGRFDEAEKAIEVIKAKK